MKQLTQAALIAAMMAVPAAGAHAAETFLGADLAWTDVDLGAGDHNPIGLGLRLGRNFGPTFGIEGRAGIGLTEDGPIDAEIDHYAGLFLRGTVPFNDLFNGYGVIGFSRAKISAGAASASDDGVSFGLGAQYHIGAMSSVHVEYLRIVEDVNAFKIGMTFNLGD